MVKCLDRSYQTLLNPILPLKPRICTRSLRRHELGARDNSPGQRRNGHVAKQVKDGHLGLDLLVDPGLQLHSKKAAGFERLLRLTRLPT